MLVCLKDLYSPKSFPQLVMKSSKLVWLVLESLNDECLGETGEN